MEEPDQAAQAQLRARPNSPRRLETRNQKPRPQGDLDEKDGFERQLASGAHRSEPDAITTAVIEELI
ncbi:MAG: hypothetical protein WAM75_02400 [Xanthobacteraceae bacterium]